MWLFKLTPLRCNRLALWETLGVSKTTYGWHLPFLLKMKHYGRWSSKIFLRFTCQPMEGLQCKQFLFKESEHARSEEGTGQPVCHVLGSCHSFDVVKAHSVSNFNRGSLHFSSACSVANADRKT